MRTTPLRRSKLTSKPSLKRKPMKVARKAPTVIKSLRTKTWELCKAITRARYGNTCYTCDKGPLVASGWQTGHFIPRSRGGMSLKYDLKNLRPQCYGCNIDLGGNGSEFYRRLVQNEGQEYVDELFSRKNFEVKETKDFYFDLIAEYKKILEEYGRDL